MILRPLKKRDLFSVKNMRIYMLKYTNAIFFFTFLAHPILLELPSHGIVVLQ